MNRKVFATLCVVTLLVGLLTTAMPAQAEGDAERYVVVFAGSRIPKQATQMVEAAGGELIKTLPEVGVGIAVSSDPGFADSLKGVRGVHSVGAERFHSLPATEAVAYEADEPDPAVDLLYEQYQWDIRRVRADQAWEVTTGSHDTVVAILDTGIAYNHPDLAPNVVHNACYSVYAPCQPYPTVHWHGTHVAGTVAAAFGGGLAVGVGPNLGLANYNVFEVHPDYGLVGFDAAIWEAMLDVAARGYDVINMSLGGYVVKPEGGAAAWTAWNRVADYVTRQGVTIVASSGNGDLDLNGPVDHVPSDVTGVISVGATGIRPDPVYPQDGAYDVRAFYSNYGASVTLSAPGGDLGPEGTPYPFPAAFYLVLSADVEPNPICAATEDCPVGYAWAAGTSMASPHVAGVAGLVIEENPRLNPNQVISILKRTAENLGDRQLFGHGMVDAYSAVK